MTVVSFPELKGGFAAASKAWLNVWTDGRVTHGEARLAMRLFLYIDGKHFQATGQLLSYPGWDLLLEKTTLHRTSIARGLKKLESLGAIKIIHGGFDPKTGRRRPNQYLLIPPNQNGNETHQVPPMTPGPGSARSTWTRSQNQVAKPGSARSTISSEVVNGESINIERPGDSNVTYQVTGKERGCPREEGTQVLPSHDPFASPSPSLNGGRQPGNGGGAVFIKYDTREAGLYERFMGRATGKPFPRSGRLSGFYVSSTEQEAVLKLAAAEGAL